MPAVLLLALSSVLVSAQDPGPLAGEPLLNRPAALAGNSVSCSQAVVYHVRAEVAERAKVKVRLINLLRESLADDAQGILNLAREKEIAKLASKLKKLE